MPSLVAHYESFITTRPGLKSFQCKTVKFCVRAMEAKLILCKSNVLSPTVLFPFLASKAS